MFVTKKRHEAQMNQLQHDLDKTLKNYTTTKRELHTLREMGANQEVTISRLQASCAKLTERYDGERERHNEVRVELAELRAELKAATERADYWKAVADKAREEAPTGDGQNFARLKAQMEMGEDEEEAAPTVESLLTRINEVHGDALPVEELIRRRDEYLEKVKNA